MHLSSPHRTSTSKQTRIHRIIQTLAAGLLENNQCISTLVQMQHHSPSCKLANDIPFAMPLKNIH
jgi:hypothetical protein